MRIQFYFLAYTQGASRPLRLWVEANNQQSARNQIMRENPYISRLQFTHSKRIE